MKFVSRPWLCALALGGAALMAMASASQADDDRGRRVPSGQCVSTPLDTTKVVDDSTLYVDDYHGHAVLLHMAGRCLGNFNDAVGLRFFGSQQICGPLDVDVTGSALTMPTPCMIASVEALSPEDAKNYKNGH